MTMRIYLYCIVTITTVLLATSAGVGQTAIDSVLILPDTAKPLSLESLYRIVLQNHPVARQVNLLSDVARQEIRLARGNFDPKFETNYLLKHYDETEYYRIFDGNIKVNTASPLQAVVGLEKNEGDYLNPENYISDTYNNNQLYAGLALSLGRGLLTDERRTALRQAELFTQQVEADQVKMINKLLLDVSKDYWDWYYSYYNFRLAVSNVDVANEIFRRVKLQYEGGEASVVDTVQAQITLLERLVDQQEATLSFQNTTNVISLYIWDSLAQPLVLPSNIAPVNSGGRLILSDGDLEELLNQARQNHPELLKLNVKLEQLELDRRLAREYLKPRLDLNYYLLDQPLNAEGWSSSFTLEDNYKFGLDVSFPLLFRKERAKIAQTKLKITSTQLDRSMTERQILTDIQNAYNELINNGAVLQNQINSVEGYRRLLAAEIINIENGESDLFKINVQQEKLFDAQSKLIKLISSYEKQKAVLYWSAGVRPISGN